MPNFRLIRSDEYWGECVGDLDNPHRVTIKLNKRFVSKRLFIDTLAHEMVHQWEWLNNETMTHGSQFFQWRRELAKYNIKLSRSYRVKHYEV